MHTYSLARPDGRATCVTTHETDIHQRMLVGMRRASVLLVTLATLLSACGESAAGRVPPTGTPQQAPAPGLKVETVAGGLEHGWDIAFLPDGKALVTQRTGKLALLSSTRPGATVTQVQADFSDVLVAGEGGLLGMVLAPDFATTREFVTCQTYKQIGRAHV